MTASAGSWSRRRARETRLLLARAATPEQAARIGDQTGGRVFLFLETDDFERDFRAMTARGVKFREAPRREDYGTVAVFEDLCGNLWDLIEPAARRGRAKQCPRNSSPAVRKRAAACVSHPTSPLASLALAKDSAVPA